VRQSTIGDVDSSYVCFDRQSGGRKSRDDRPFNEWMTVGERVRGARDRINIKQDLAAASSASPEVSQTPARLGENRPTGQTRVTRIAVSTMAITSVTFAIIAVEQPSGTAIACSSSLAIVRRVDDVSLRLAWSTAEIRPCGYTGRRVTAPVGDMHVSETVVLLQ